MTSRNVTKSRRVPTTESPPYEPAYEPYLKVGSLVTLKQMQENHDNDIPFWRGKHSALVLEVFWSPHDKRWDAGAAESLRADPGFVSVPAAVLLWNDGKTTNTTQNALEVISESR